MAAKTYGGAQILAGPLGALTGFSRTARMAAPVIGIGLLGNDVRRAGNDLLDSDLPWPRRLEKAVELAAGLKGGFLRRGQSNFARGQSAGEWASGNTRFGRSFGSLEHRAIERSLDVAIHRGLGSVSNTLHQRASQWATQRGYKACFGAGTKLLAKGPWGQGWRAIESITTDDFVASRDENNPNGTIEWKAVGELFQRTAPVLSLTVNGQVMRISRSELRPEHEMKNGEFERRD